MANSSKGVLFLTPSDAYVRSFLYLLYTLIKLYYTKLWVIKPHLWPRIEFFSSGAQESWRLCVVQQQPFSSSLLSAIRVVSSAYLRLLIFLLAILIPPCASSSLLLLMMYSASKSNKQSDSRQPCHTPFPIWHQFVVPCPVLTISSWPENRFLRRQVR